MVWIAPLPHRQPEPDEYLDLGQQENPRVWVPVGVGMMLVPVLLIIAELFKKL